MNDSFGIGMKRSTSRGSETSWFLGAGDVTVGEYQIGEYIEPHQSVSIELDREEASALVF